MELDAAEQLLDEPVLVAAIKNPPWLAGDDHEDEINQDDDGFVESSAETDSDAADSMSIEEYVTDSDSDATWMAKEGSQNLGGEVKNKWWWPEDDSSDHSRPATDAEQYDMNAAVCFTTETESDPETEQEVETAAVVSDREPQQGEAAQQAATSCSCLAISFGNLSVNLQCAICKPVGGATAGDVIVSGGPSNSSNTGATTQGPAVPAVPAAPANTGATSTDMADAAAVSDIRHYQATVHSLMSQVAFKELVLEVLQSVRDARLSNCNELEQLATVSVSDISDRAVRALQVASEDCLIRIFEAANKVAIDDGRQKVLPSDLRAAAAMMQPVTRSG